MALHAHQEISHYRNESSRRANTQYVIDSMALEGVTLDAETLAMFEAYDRGDISADALFQMGIAHITAQKLKNSHSNS